MGPAGRRRSTRLLATSLARTAKKGLRRAPRSWWRAVRWPVLAYVPAVVALSQVRRRIDFPRPVMIPVASAAPLAVAVALPRGKRRYAAVWATYLWLFNVAHQIPFDQPDKLARRVRVRESVRADGLIGCGAPLPLRLQRALRDPPRLTALDWALTALYFALWLPPHLMLTWLLVRHEEEFPRRAAQLAAVYHLTTVGYWIRPSAPPWWASEKEGEMGGHVQRVTRDVQRTLMRKLRGRDPDDPDSAGGEKDWRAHGNPWASMPSDHLAGAAMAALWLSEMGAKTGALGFAYVLFVAFIVVYLGEHYVIDVVAAIALAEAVRRVEPALRPLARVAVPVLRALEPPRPRRRVFGAARRGVLR